MMINVLKKRFEENRSRHESISWSDVEKRLTADPESVEVLRKMEESGGEPDAIAVDSEGRIIFADCYKEAPAQRCSLCYDDEALRSRKKNPPVSSAMAQAQKMGVRLMNEKLYRLLQQTGEYDLKTSCWIDTPLPIRQKGGALFAERRYDTVFVFHNGADSYYSVRGWRGFICL